MAGKVEVLAELSQALGMPPATAEALAREIVMRGQRNERAGLEEFFQAVEDHLIYGEEDVKAMLTVDLIENIKNHCSWANFDYEYFEPWLQPEAYRVWRWLEKKWQGKQSLADAAKDET
jgi:hypothetical protein